MNRFRWLGCGLLPLVVAGCSSGGSTGTSSPGDDAGGDATAHRLDAGTPDTGTSSNDAAPDAERPEGSADAGADEGVGDTGVDHSDAGDASAADARASNDAESGAPVSGFVTASGTNLMLGGQVFHFIGFDAYGMEGCFNGTAWTVAQLDAYFAGLPTNGMTRIWTFRSYGTAAIQKILTEAAKYGQHVVLSLANDDGNCDPDTTDPNQTGEPLSFYQTGWMGQYVTWINTVVPMFKDNTTIAMWEISNEPGQATAVPEATMKAYLSGAAAAIKAVDTNHLVESGVNDSANVGNFQDTQSSPDIDVLSFHDYAWDYENKAVESGNFTVAQAAAKALNKPFIAGEAGVESGPTCTKDLTQAQRVTYLQSKTDAYFKGLPPGSSTAGPAIAGVMYWEYEPVNTYGWTTGECEYDFFAGDPLLTMVKNYVVP